MRKFALLLILPLLLSCSLRRDNPLDPLGNPDVVIPGDISGLNVTSFGSNTASPYVDLEWDSNSTYNTDGYYVYRSLGYYNKYAIVATVDHATGGGRQSYTHSSENDGSVAPGDYWYAIAAFKSYSGGTLEGRMSAPKFVRI